MRRRGTECTAACGQGPGHLRCADDSHRPAARRATDRRVGPHCPRPPASTERREPAERVQRGDDGRRMDWLDAARHPGFITHASGSHGVQMSSPALTTPTPTTTGSRTTLRVIRPADQSTRSRPFHRRARWIQLCFAPNDYILTDDVHPETGISRVVDGRRWLQLASASGVAPQHLGPNLGHWSAHGRELPPLMDCQAHDPEEVDMGCLSSKSVPRTRHTTDSPAGSRSSTDAQRAPAIEAGRG